MTDPFEQGMGFVICSVARSAFPTSEAAFDANVECTHACVRKCCPNEDSVEPIELASRAMVELYKEMLLLSVMMSGIDLQFHAPKLWMI